MKFQENAKPIYLQIADRICDEVVSGALGIDTRIPSVREYAASLQVNVNTVMRTFEYLSAQEIIYNRRGIGYFVAPDAIKKIEQIRCQTFFSSDLTYVFDRLISMGVTPERLNEIYTKYYNEKR